MNLPQELVNKIFLYNQSPTAKIMKDMINAFEWSFRNGYKGENIFFYEDVISFYDYDKERQYHFDKTKVFMRWILNRNTIPYKNLFETPRKDKKILGWLYLP